MKTVAVIDYGMGNLHSAAKALEHVAPDGMRVEVTASPDVILEADRVVLPGVGANSRLYGGNLPAGCRQTSAASGAEPTTARYLRRHAGIT